MILPAIPFRSLEVHVSHACNLRCYNCSHYSEHGHKGVVSLAEFEDWSAPWCRKIQPQDFNLLGGEPALHKQLAEFVVLARRLWPRSKLILVSNGLLLKNHPGLPEALEKTNTLLSLSIHHDSPKYREKLAAVRSLLDSWQAVYRFGLEWRESYSYWTRIYRGYGPDMQPYDDRDPAASYRNCWSKHSKQLYLGKIWKCPPLAYLHMQKEKYDIGPAWDKYLAYRPLEPTASCEEIERFLSLEAEHFCEMCPANPEGIEKPSPFKMVQLEIRK
jgi:hypothetical protein